MHALLHHVVRGSEGAPGRWYFHVAQTALSAAALLLVAAASERTDDHHHLFSAFSFVVRGDAPSLRISSISGGATYNTQSMRAPPTHVINDDTRLRDVGAPRGRPRRSSSHHHPRPICCAPSFYIVHIYCSSRFVYLRREGA